MKGRSGRVQVSCDFSALEYSRKVLYFSYALILVLWKSALFFLCADHEGGSCHGGECKSR